MTEFRVDVVRARPRSLKQNFASEEFLAPRRSQPVVGARRGDGLLRQLDETNALERRRFKNVAQGPVGHDQNALQLGERAGLDAHLFKNVKR